MEQVTKYLKDKFLGSQGQYNMTSPNEQKRARPDGRKAKPTLMVEGENDRRIVRLVYQYGLLSQQQIEQLMGLSRPTVQRLLRRLYDHAYLERQFLPIARFGSSPALYVLDREGKSLLRRMGIENQAGILGKDLSPLYLQHMLSLNDVHIAIELACATDGYQLGEWLTDNRLKADYDRVKIASSPKPVSVIPDGFFWIDVPNLGKTFCFMELDRGTTDVSDFTRKVEAYVAYYKSGQYTKRYGAQGFRVLTVVEGIGEGRVENLRQATAKMGGIGRRFWFTHINHISRETVLHEPIWSIAGGEGKSAFIEPKRE